MKTIIAAAVMGGLLTRAVLAQESTLPSHSMPSDAAPSISITTNRGTGDTNTMGRFNNNAGFNTTTIQRSTNSAIRRSGGALNNNVDTRVDTKAGTTAQPIRGSGTTGTGTGTGSGTDAGGATALPAPSAPKF